MTDQQNVQVVQEAYAAFGRGDIRGILDRVTDDVDWHTLGPESIRQTRPRHGRAEVEQYFAEVGEDWQFTTFEPLQFVAQGDDVVCLGRYAAIAKATGRSFASDWAMHFVMRDGKIARFREYADTASVQAALESKSARTAGA